MCWTQYQFGLFINKDCSRLLHEHYLNKTDVWLFHNNLMQLHKIIYAVACSKPPALEICSEIIQYLIGADAECLWHKRPCDDSETVPLDMPCS